MDNALSINVGVSYTTRCTGTTYCKMDITELYENLNEFLLHFSPFKDEDDLVACIKDFIYSLDDFKYLDISHLKNNPNVKITGMFAVNVDNLIEEFKDYIKDDE